MACKNNNNPFHLTTIFCQFVVGLAMDSTVLLRLQFFSATAKRLAYREFWVGLCVQLESLSLKLTTLMVFQMLYLLNVGITVGCQFSFDYVVRYWFTCTLLISKAVCPRYLTLYTRCNLSLLYFTPHFKFDLWVLIFLPPSLCASYM
jgi:hypothetical protein